MIDIKVDGESLDLLPSTTIRMEYNNPMFDWAIIPGTSSFPFEVPDTDANRRILNFRKSILRAGDNNAFVNCKMYVGGLPLLEGKLFIHKATDSGYSVYIAAESGDLATSITGKYLTDLAMGGPRFMGTTNADFTAAMLATTSGAWPDQDFVFFPVYNPGMAADREDLELPSISGLWPDGTRVICHVQNYFRSGQFWPEWFGHGTAFAPFDFNVVWAIAYPYVHYILQEIVKLGGYNLQGEWINDPEMRTLVLNSLQIRPYSARYQPTGDYSIELSKGLPKISLADFLIGLRKTFCLGMFFNSQSKTLEVVPLKSLINATQYDDWTLLVERTYQIELDTIPVYEFKWTVDQNDQTAAQLHELDASMKLPPVATFLILGAITTDPLGSLRLLESEWYWWQYANDTNIPPTAGWYPVSLPWQDITNLGSNQKIVSPFSPVKALVATDSMPYDYQWFGPDVFLRRWKIPELRQGGTFNIVKISTASDSPRLLFYRGMVEDSNGDLYPLGSSDNFTFDGVRIGNYSLSWDGDDGLYNNWWKDFVYFHQNTKRVTRRIYLTLGELMRLDLKRKKLIDGVTYFVEKLTVNISMKGVGIADITLLKV